MVLSAFGPSAGVSRGTDRSVGATADDASTEGLHTGSDFVGAGPFAHALLAGGAAREAGSGGSGGDGG